MDLKVLPLSDQLPYAYCSSPRRKVFSRFGFAMVISMLLLTVVIFHLSFRAPFMDSVWQGFHYNSSSPLSFWSLNSVNNGNNNTLEKLEPFGIRNEKNESVSMDDSGGKKVVALEDAQMGKGTNGENVIPLTSPISEIDKNVTFINNINITAEGNSLDSSKVSNDSSSHQGAKPDSFYGDCDIFQGRWVRDDSLKPYYPPGSCPFIDRDFDCHLNKRPDIDYVKWKWQPHGCDIPSLNGTDFLERIRGQKLVFVGDSLNRNMWESLICILRHSVPDKERVYEISGKTEFKKGGFYAFRFEDYNCSVDFVNSPFLVQESSYDRGNGSFDTLRLDLMDEVTSMYQDADVLIFNTAHWWTHEKTSRGEDYYQEGDHVHRRLKVLEAYKRAISTWARWVDKHINHNRTRVIFRGYSGVHFSGGQWNSGGQCHKETEPIYDERHLEKYPRKMKALEYVLHDMKTPVIYLNISMLTEFRKDAHPSIYRKEYKTIEERIAGEQSQDCSHWCLPGVPDTWNELLYASLLRAAGR